MFLDPIIITFLIIGIGYIVNKKIGFDQVSINNLLIYVTGPALTFTLLLNQEIILEELSFLFIGVGIVMFITGVIMKLFLLSEKINKNNLVLPAIFVNSGYLGLPLVLFALGEAGLSKAILVDSIATIFMFSIGVYLVQNNSMKKTEKILAIFKLPLIYSVIFGLAFNFASIEIPQLIFAPLELIGRATIPLALLALGAKLGKIKVATLKVPLVTVVIRLIGGFLVSFGIIKIFALDSLTASVFLLIMVMPPAVNSFVLNQKFGSKYEADCAATTVLIGTLLSVIPIAIVLSIV